MADFDNAFNIINQGIKDNNFGDSYQKGLTEARDNQAMKYKLSDLANQDVVNKQNFQDQQAQRSALQNNVKIDPATGKSSLDQQGATSQLMSQNPVLAKQLQQSLGTQDLALAEQKMQRNQQYLGMLKIDPQTGKSNLAEIKAQALADPMDLSSEWKSAPDDGGVNTIYAMQQGGQHLNDQLANHMAQLKMQNEFKLKAFEKGYDVSGMGAPSGPQPIPGQPQSQPQKPQAQAGTPQSPTPLPILERGEANDKGIKAYDDALSNRKLNDPAYANAGTSLAAVKNANSIFNKYKDLNDISTQDAHILAGEAAKAIKGGGASATEQEVEDLLPKNVMSGTSNLWAKGVSKPVPTNNAEYYQSLKDYFGDLKQNSMDTIQAAHELAEQNAIAQGINPKTLAIKKSASAKELTGLANGYGGKHAVFTPEISNYATTHGITTDQASKIIAARKAKAK